MHNIAKIIHILHFMLLILPVIFFFFQIAVI